jgi:hypothetical protein
MGGWLDIARAPDEVKSGGVDLEIILLRLFLKAKSNGDVVRNSPDSFKIQKGYRNSDGDSSLFLYRLTTVSYGKPVKSLA